MRVLSLICCENVIRDAGTNQITAYNVIDDISSSGFPLLIPKFSVYFFSERMESDPETIEVKLSIISENVPLFTQTFPINYKGKNKNKTMVTIRGIVVGVAGSIFVKVETSAGDSLYTKEILVTVKQQLEVSKP